MITTDIKILRQVSEEATQEDYNKIIPLLEQELDKVKDRGIGLSATQIGYPIKLGIIKYSNRKIELINPVITEKFDRFRFKGERCLSLPGLSIDTARYKDITIETGFNRKILCLYGIEAIACQHEINHFLGKLIIDKGIKWRKRR